VTIRLQMSPAVSVNLMACPPFRRPRVAA
jgi:hypothetical protein